MLINFAVYVWVKNRSGFLFNLDLTYSNFDYGNYWAGPYHNELDHMAMDKNDSHFNPHSHVLYQTCVSESHVFIPYVYKIEFVK